MADLNALASKYRSGEVTLEQLQSQYKLSTSDIEKIRQINAKIDKELGVKDGKQPLPGSIELTLEDGTKLLAAKIRTVNQPKGGFVNVYVAQDGKQYYQYTDANGKQQKISTSWNYLGAWWDNCVSSVGKMADGHPIDGIVQMFSGAEDPRNLSIGEAPAAGFAKGAGWLSKLKDVKFLGQFKNFAKSLIKSTPKMTLQTKTRTLSNGTQYQAKFFKTNKSLTTASGKSIPAGAEIEAHAGTLTASGVNNKGELLLDVFVDGKPEVIVLKGGGFHSKTWTMENLNHYAGDNYNDLLPKIMEFINNAH